MAEVNICRYLVQRSPCPRKQPAHPGNLAYSIDRQRGIGTVDMDRARTGLDSASDNGTDAAIAAVTIAGGRDRWLTENTGLNDDGPSSRADLYECTALGRLRPFVSTLSFEPTDL